MSMGALEYAGIRMEIKETNEISRVNLRTPDGANYLYTRWIFDVLCVINPEALSVASGVVFASGMAPSETDNNIRRRLRQDRQTLKYFVGNSLLVQSPPDMPPPAADGRGAPMDSNGGPVVEQLSVVALHGIKTIYVHLRIITWVNDCKVKRFGGGAPGEEINLQGIQATFGLDVAGVADADVNPMIAHRWTRHVDIDPMDYSTSLVTEGVAVFDMTVLSRLGAYPDQYRKDLFFPVPSGMQRGPISVTPDSDGTSVSYRFVDSEKFVHAPNNANVTRVECYHTGYFARNSLTDSMLRGVPVLMGGLAALGDLRIGSALASLPSAVGTIISHYAPRAYFNCLVRVWGNKNSLRVDLINLAVATAMHWRLGVPSNFDNVEFIITIDVMGKWVEVNATYRTGMEQILGVFGDLPLIGPVVEAGIAAIAAVIGAPPPVAFAGAITFEHVLAKLGGNPALPALDPGEAATLSLHPVTKAPSSVVPARPIDIGRPELVVSPVDGFAGPNPGPPNSSGTRGTFLGALVHQILSGGACDRYGVPPLYPHHDRSLTGATVAPPVPRPSGA